MKFHCSTNFNEHVESFSAIPADRRGKWIRRKKSRVSNNWIQKPISLASFLFIVTWRDIIRNLFTCPKVSVYDTRESWKARVRVTFIENAPVVSLIIAEERNYSIGGSLRSILIKNNQYRNVNKCLRSFSNCLPLSWLRHIFSFTS